MFNHKKNRFLWFNHKIFCGKTTKNVQPQEKTVSCGLTTSFFVVKPQKIIHFVVKPQKLFFVV